MGYGTHRDSGKPPIAALIRRERVGWPWIVSCCREPYHVNSTLPMGAASHNGSEAKFRLQSTNPPNLMPATHNVRQFTLKRIRNEAFWNTSPCYSGSRNIGVSGGFALRYQLGGHK